ncbi:MAG: hypothetical protein AB7O21_03955 [Gammaproteobacteria bacterium]
MRNRSRPDTLRLQVLRDLVGLLFALLLMSTLPIPEAHGAAPGPSTELSSAG